MSFVLWGSNRLKKKKKKVGLIDLEAKEKVNK